MICDTCKAEYTDWGRHAATFRHWASLWVARFLYF